MSPMTGAEMVVTRRRIDARKMKTTPILFPQARLAVPAQQMIKMADGPVEDASHRVGRLSGVVC